MNKKADVEIMGKSFTGIAVGVLSLILVFFAAYYIFNGLFNGNWECKDSENDLNLISQYIENYQKGELNGIRSINQVYLAPKCVFVGFNAGESSSYVKLTNTEQNIVENINVTRPKQCKGESCICLCERGAIHNEEDWKGICLNRNKCETFKEVESFTSENGNLMIFPSLTSTLAGDNFDLNINYKSKNICLSKTEGVCLNG